MQKLRLKEIQRLKNIQQIKEGDNIRILRQQINHEEQLKEAFLYSEDIYEHLLNQFSNIQKQHLKQQHQIVTDQIPNRTSKDLNSYVNQLNPLSDYTPASISKLIFDHHLQKIYKQFIKAPDSQVKLEHFLLIMMKVLFIDPSIKVRREMQDEILKTVVKEQNQKQGLNSFLLNASNYIKSGQGYISNDNNNKPKQMNGQSSLATKRRPSPKKQRMTNLRQEMLKAHQQQKSKQKINQSTSFDKYPFYIVALTLMFRQIVEQNKQTISYHQLSKFIMGQVIDNKNEASNTQFTIQFQENKKQDFLLHDNGISKLSYCNSLNIYICLDTKQSMIKIYNSELKNKLNFQPNKFKHNRKSPEIVDIFYSDFNYSMGLVLANKSIQIVNLQAFMTKLYEKQFLPFAMNEIVVKFQNPMRKIFFLQMFNKWLVVGQKNQLTLVDVSKYKSKDQEMVISNIKNQKPELKITNVLEIIPLSAVCIIAGNQVWFYDQKLSKKKFCTYNHELNITQFKYYEQKNLFYLCGYKEKAITVLKPQRGRQSLQINSILYSRPIVSFEVFSLFNSILLIDDKQTLRLISQGSKQVYQVQEYTRIVKRQQKQQDQDQQGKKINIIKINKQNFVIYESYMISLGLAKVAVETQSQFHFMPYFHFDQAKEDIYISFNNQVLCISLLEGEIRQSFSNQNSNINSPIYFSIPQGLKPFIVDLQNKIYDLYSKDSQFSPEKQNLKYRKKLQIKGITNCFYDQQLNRCLLLSSQQLYQIKNEGNNAFGVINITKFHNIDIVSTVYISQKKSLVLNCISQNGKNHDITKTQPFILQLNINRLNSHRCRRYRFQQLKQSDKEDVILSCLCLEEYSLEILLTDQNIIYLIDTKANQEQFKQTSLLRKSTSDFVDSQQQQSIQQSKSIKQLCIKLYFFLPPKVRDIFKFTEIYLNKVKTKDSSANQQKKGNIYYSLFVTTEQGFFIQIKLNNLLKKQFQKHKTIKQVQRNPPLPQFLDIYYERFLSNNEISQIVLKKSTVYQFQMPNQTNNKEQEILMIKGHNNAKIEIIKKIQLQFLLTLSIGKDGFLKLWHQKQCIISLKFPSLRKQIFQVKRIQNIRSKRVIQNTLKVVQKINGQIIKKQKLSKIIQMTKEHEFDKKIQCIDERQPIKIQIQNKFVEEIVNYQPNYHATIQSSNPSLLNRLFNAKRNQNRSNNFKLSLKKQRSFQSLLQKSQLKEKNSIQIPRQIMQLRKSLKKYETIKSKSIDLDRDPTQKQLFILPILNSYRVEAKYKSGFTTERKIEDAEGRYGDRSQRQTTVDSEKQQYDNFEACVFVKNKVGRKKANQLDRIDKQFIRKQYNLLAKKHLAKRKQTVQILSNRVPVPQKQEQENEDKALNLETIIKDIRRIKYETKYGGERYIPKVRLGKQPQNDN